MSSDRTNRKYRMPAFTRPILIIVGGYGSGKSEVSVNLAAFLARSQSKPVAIADLDIVNPYFRSREATKQLEALGVRSINPTGEQFHSELPIILPEVKGSIQKHEGYLILDVGGDDVGARVLSSLNDAFTPGSYEMLLVLNANRPFTSDLRSSLQMIAKIEASSKLRFTGIISNTHLLEQTDAEMIERGYRLSIEVAREAGVEVSFIAALANVLKKINTEAFDTAVLPLERQLLKPWEQSTRNST
ncbi:MAG TPA: cobalamin biosynthesis protein CbiA [candidate division Zixibacteria bacterium]|nr:cobalamin biosynthesis protein CbiA [candidate division Zixibacteria bacterium]